MIKINSKIKAFLFDLDDTLLNSQFAQYNAVCDFKKSFCELDKVDKNEFAELWGKITEQLYAMYTKGEITFATQRTERVKRIFLHFNIKIDDNEAKQRFKKYLTLYEKNWCAFDDAIELLEQLKNTYKLAIITNGDSKQQRDKIEKIGVTKYFSEIIISSEVGFSKPSKGIFKIACEKLKVKPEECIMVGDKFKVDIEGSNNCGMTGIWVNRKNENIKYKYEIKQLNEILKPL